MAEILLPPNYRSIEGSLIFLGGPIKGAPLWQNQAIPIIQSLNNKINIASPSRRVDSAYLQQNPACFKHSSNQEDWEQVDWETYHLNLAAFGHEDKGNGSILFWLPKEEKHYCSRAYAQTSRFEIGEWLGEHSHTNANIVIGIEEGFSGETYLKYRLKKNYPKVPICSTLEETCRVAVDQITGGV